MVTITSSNTGFSLIELITVIIILGIISISVLGKLDFNGFDSRGYTDELVSALRYSQKIAVANNCASRITFSAGVASLTQSNDALPCSSSSSFSASIKNPVTGSAYNISAPNNISLSPTSSVYFYADGSAENNSNINILDNGTSTSCIHIVQESGYVYSTSGAC